MSNEEIAAPPSEFPALLGHEKAEKAFMDAFQSGRLPHAWLVTGKKGIGKASLTYRFALFLLQQDGDGGNNLLGSLDGQPPHLSSSEDPIARQVMNRSHPDLRVIELQINERTGKRQSEIPVDEIRSLATFLRLTPSISRWRAVIIDSVDDLNRNAANALLKSLEEPRANTVLFLISHAPGRLLPTIRSRCRRLPLSPLPPSDIVAFLNQRNMAQSDVPLVTDLADGSLGHALELAEDNAIEIIKSVWGILTQWPNYDPADLHRMGDQLAERGANANFERMVEMLAWWWHRYARYVAGVPLPPILPGEQELAQRWLKRAGLDQWLSLWEKINGLFAQVEIANADRKQAWIASMLEIASIGAK